MDVLRNVDAVLNVNLFAILVGLTLTAVAILWSALRRERSTSRLDIIEAYIGVVCLTGAFACFLVGLVLTFFFDSVAEPYNDILAIEVCDVILTGVPLFLGIALLYAGGGNLIRLVTKRKLRLVPGCLAKAIDRPIGWAVNRLLPPQK